MESLASITVSAPGWLVDSNENAGASDLGLNVDQRTWETLPAAADGGLVRLSSIFSYLSPSQDLHWRKSERRERTTDWPRQVLCPTQNTLVDNLIDIRVALKGGGESSSKQNWGAVTTREGGWVHCEQKHTLAAELVQIPTLQS